ncbi:MAG: vanadium-dependent haloperoxidase [Verrucomicrobiae bacterium]|nr:vanadium-dependent haloperoxidase [Verrucomicrobiae bacterium]
MKLKHYSLAAAAALTVLTTSASADVVTDWNLITLNATKTAGQNSNLGSRVDAIEAIAVYDAVNSIRQFGTPYHYYSPNTGSAQAAAAQAAHDVLVNYYPAQASALNAALASSLAGITDGPVGNGTTVGTAAAADIIALRASDGASPNVTYPGPGTIAPGVYQLTPNIPTVTSPPFTFGVGINVQWGGVTPFLLAATNQFRPGPPPALNSVQFSNDLAQVQSLGSLNSVTRTPDQTHVAQFYKQDAELTVNEAARQLSLANGLSLEQNALLFVLTDIAVADARIAVWDAKYTYLNWRPITALNANPDGTVTNNYAAWQPLIVTPNHPEYPSGHGGTVNAGFEVLKTFFGDQNTLLLHTTTAGEPPRLIPSLTQGELENVLSRVYGGIHFWFSDTTGQNIGNQVAAYVLANGPHLITQSTTNATSQLGIATYPAITITGTVGQAYRIDYATSLAPTNWTTLKYVTLPTASPYLIYDNSAGTHPQRFYRAVSVAN